MDVDDDNNGGDPGPFRPKFLVTTWTQGGLNLRAYFTEHGDPQWLCQLHIEVSFGQVACSLTSAKFSVLMTSCTCKVAEIGLPASVTSIASLDCPF